MRVIPCGSSNLIEASIRKTEAIRAEEALKKFSSVMIPSNIPYEEARPIIEEALKQAVQNGARPSYDDYEKLFTRIASNGVKIGDGSREAIVKEALWCSAAGTLWNFLGDLGKDVASRWKASGDKRRMQALMGQIQDLRSRFQQVGQSLNAAGMPDVLKDISGADAALAGIQSKIQAKIGGVPEASSTPGAEASAPEAPETLVPTPPPGAPAAAGSPAGKVSQPGPDGKCPAGKQPTATPQGVICTDTGVAPKPAPKPKPYGRPAPPTLPGVNWQGKPGGPAATPQFSGLTPLPT